MNDYSDALSDEQPPVQPKPYDQVLESIKSYKQNRLSREGQLQNMHFMKEALRKTGFDTAREFIADQVPAAHQMDRKMRQTGEFSGDRPHFAVDSKLQDSWNPRSSLHRESPAALGLPLSKQTLDNYKSSLLQQPSPRVGLESNRSHTTDSPLKQLMEFRKNAIKENPDFYKQLLEVKPRPTADYFDDPEDLEYTGEMRDRIDSPRHNSSLLKPQKLEPDASNPQFISHASAFGLDSGLKASQQQSQVAVKVLPFFCRVLQAKFNSKTSRLAFNRLKDLFFIGPKKGGAIRKLEKILVRNDQMAVMGVLKGLYEAEIERSDKLLEVHKKNLKRILFDQMKEFKKYQQDWIAQVRSTIQKAVVFSSLKRNAHEERMMRRTALYYHSRILSVWKKVTAGSIMEANNIADEFVVHRNYNLAKRVFDELRANNTANKQERKRENEALLHYQKVRVFLLFDYWKSLSVKRKKPVDFSKYAGMQSIPIRVTQRKNIEIILEEDFTKVVRSRDVGTSYKLLHPNTKI